MKFAKRYDKKAREVFEKYQTFEDNFGSALTLC